MGARKAASRKSGGISPAILVGAVVAVVVVIVLVGALLFKGGSKTIDLNKYATVTFEGEDGFGTASIEMDTEKFAKDNKKLFKVDEKQLKKNLTKYLKNNDTVADLIGFAYGDVDDMVDDLFDELEDEFDTTEITQDDLEEIAELMANYYEIDPNYDLENGDKVEVTFEISPYDKMELEMIQAMFGFDIKADDRTVKVKGLD